MAHLFQWRNLGSGATQFGAHGLGGRNVVVEYGAVEFYRRALTEIWPDWETEESNFSHDPTRRAIALQRVTGGNFNFRHGGFYLTPSRATALRYATANRFGSEMISNCFELYQELTEQGDLPQALRSFSGLVDLFERNELHQAMVIKVNRVFVADLCGENGGGAAEPLTRLLSLIEQDERQSERYRELKRAAGAGEIAAMTELLRGSHREGLGRDGVIERYGQQANFEVVGVISARDLSFEEVPLV